MIPLQKDMIAALEKLKNKYCAPMIMPDMDDCPLCEVNNKHYNILPEEEKGSPCANCPWTIIGWKGARNCAEHMKNFKYSDPWDLRNGKDYNWNQDSKERVRDWLERARTYEPKSTVTRYIEKSHKV